MHDLTGSLARDPYTDPTPSGGARKEIVCEEVREPRRAEGDASSNGAEGAVGPKDHPTRPASPDDEAVLPLQDSQLTYYEPKKLEKALYELKSERLGEKEYRVSGGAKEHQVKLDGDGPCDCEDFHYRSRPCKHIYHCLLREGDIGLLSAAGEIVKRKNEIIAELFKSARSRRRQARGD